MTQGYYDREKTVAIITSFYQFFATLPSISPADIAYPPPGGWPDITPESHAALKKNDDVINLYKHLPYLNKRREISYLTYASDWRLENIKSKIQSGAVDGSEVGPLPDYVAVLTDGNKHGSYLLLDTQNGTITDYRRQEHPERKEPPFDSSDNWKSYLTLPTSAFFESWKEKFRSGEFLVIPRNDDRLLIGWDDPLREMNPARGRQPTDTTEAKKPQFKALYDFSAQEDNEVTLIEDEIVTVLQKSSSGWSLAKTASGSMGWVPSTYIEEIEVEPIALSPVIEPTSARTISKEKYQEKLQAQVTEKKERAKIVAKEEQEPTWLYDMMDQISEMKILKLKQVEKNARVAGHECSSDIEEVEIEMKEFMAKVDSTILKEAEQEFAAHMESAEKQTISPKIHEFEEWLNQWLELKQDKERAWYLSQDSSSDVEKSELSMLEFKVRMEAELFTEEMESFEDEMHTTIVSEYEEWLGDPVEEEKIF